MVDYENRRWYKCNPGNYCGVLMPENVMKKLAKLSAKYSEEVRRILYENKENLIPYEWTMASDKDEAGNIKDSVYVTYSCKNVLNKVEERINLFVAQQPEYVEKVYFVKDNMQAKVLAEQLLKEKLANESD